MDAQKIISNNNQPALSVESVLSLQNTFLSHASLQESATALVSEIALKHNFDRVSIGLNAGKQTDLLASSYQSNIDKNTEFSNFLTAAMDEAALQNNIISYPDSYNDIPRITQAHAKLMQHSNFACCSIPIVNKNHLIGVFTLERNAAKPITIDEILTLEHTIGLLSPLIDLKNNSNQPLIAQFKTRLSSWFNQQHQGLNYIKYGFFALLALSAALLFVPVEYNIKAPARLEGIVQRALVSPNDGFLQQTYVRPGDIVKKDQLLLEFSDQDLVLEKNRWESELAQYENAYGASIAGADRVQMVINQTKMEEARSQLTLAEHKLERAKVYAPFDGVIIKGDLKQSLGAPVQRGDVLMTISPDGQFRLIAEVDERDVSRIKKQQQGVVTLVSLPNKSIAIQVKSITPVATTRDGRNFFEVESSFRDKMDDTNLRPGLKGVVKISVGEKPFIWIWTHRIIDWLSLTLWSWGM
jgi:Barrel-sandwich domain of CusB or HlyD membrane-fusion/GAF domain